MLLVTPIIDAVERWLVQLADPGLAHGDLLSLQPNVGSWYIPPRQHAIEFLLVNTLFITVCIFAGFVAIRRGTKISSSLIWLAAKKPPARTFMYRLLQTVLIVSWLMTFKHKYVAGTLAYMTQPCHMNVLLLIFCMSWPQVKPMRIKTLRQMDKATPVKASHKPIAERTEEASPSISRTPIPFLDDTERTLRQVAEKIRSSVKNKVPRLTEIEWHWAYLPHVIFNAYCHHVWATTFALIAPDMRGYSQRFEATNFWVEHLMLLLVPFYLTITQHFPLFKWSWSFCLASFCMVGLWHTLFLTLWSLQSGWNLDYVLSPPVGIVDVLFGHYYRPFMYGVCFVCTCLSRLLVGVTHAGLVESKETIERHIASRHSRSRTASASVDQLIDASSIERKTDRVLRSRHHVSSS